VHRDNPFSAAGRRRRRGDPNQNAMNEVDAGRDRATGAGGEGEGRRKSVN